MTAKRPAKKKVKPHEQPKTKAATPKKAAIVDSAVSTESFTGFDPVDPRQSFPALEEGILRYWREEDMFKRSIAHRENGEIYSFYDGPPFATGLPHYGHILAGTIKDVIPRYQTMRGKKVKRRFGWDCHGLPVENEIEKQYNLKGKKDIEALGIKEFNDLCRAAVLRYTGDWRTTVERMGRWVDMDWDYRTMDPDYMESIWWVFKQLYDKGLIYEGYKPMHICPRCATPLANFEVTQGYRDTTDWSVIVTFPLKDDKNTRLLAWTTTPWTLPSNLFLAMGADIPYVRVRMDDKDYIVAKPLVDKVFGRMRFEVIQDVSVHEFVGKKYVPLFPYDIDTPVEGNAEQKTYGELAYEVVLSDIVDIAEGTGIVHIAPAYGEDDFKIGQERKIGIRRHVTIDGCFTDDVADFAGMGVKPAQDRMATDRKIARFLDEKKRLFSEGSITHSYPHCWRCETPLLNYATSSWFVEVESLREQMLKNNSLTQWVPSNIRDGRFGKWLEGARDWTISRSRYWGTPLPIWRNEKTKEIHVIGSRDELMDMAPGRFTKITIARHAQSKGNVDGIYQGELPGTPLTAFGKKQAERLAQRIGADTRKVIAIYHSPLDRTQQTAQGIAKATRAPLIADTRLKEVSFGEYEGRHVDFDLTFMKERRAHKLDQKQVESIYHFPGMETWAQVEERCKAFLEEILPRHRGEHIVIVTHADVLMNFTHLFTGQDKHQIVHQPYPELAGSKTFYYDHDTGKQMDLHKETVDGIIMCSKEHDAKSSVILTLVRHGETDWNVQGKLQGSSDIPLNDQGRRQAQEIADQLDSRDFDIILSSDLKRAKETAEIIATTLGKKHIIDDIFAEQNLGDWEGKTKPEILKLFPQFITDHLFLYKNIPNGESPVDLKERALRAKEKLLKEYGGKRILVVSHRRWISMLMNIERGTPVWQPVENTAVEQITLSPHLQRIPDVLDCWFESGSMPYAQEHFPFDVNNVRMPQRDAVTTPIGFPADFIAEGLDQTRGWFYTLTVLSTILFDQPAFRHCVVNGIVLAQDGKKMSKRLKNYPEPLDVVHKHGADSVRFALMSSPAVRGEDLRFSEKLVEETLRNVILPLWNAYNLFVTYASAAQWKPGSDFGLMNASPDDPLDQWIVAVTQDLVNRMTEEFEGYDLSATCAQLADSIDGLTNWYIRLSRKRFAAKPSTKQAKAFDTFYRVLLTNCQLLAPFCPFVSEAIYLNLTNHEHGSIHLSDWPQTRDLTEKEKRAIAMMRNTQTVVTLGLSLRSDAKIRVRQPLASVTFGLPPADEDGVRKDIIREELNVKEVVQTKDPGSLASAYVQVDARKAGPRLGAKVQDIIREGKAGHFSCDRGGITILGETLSPDEARLMYVGAQGQNVACDHGIVVTLDTTVTESLRLEGVVRELVRAIQSLRKQAGLSFTDTILLSVSGMPDVLQAYGEIISRDTRAVLKDNTGTEQVVTVGETTFTIRIQKSDQTTDDAAKEIILDELDPSLPSPDLLS